MGSQAISEHSNTTLSVTGKLKILFSNVDIFSFDKICELKNKIKVMEKYPHIIALQEVKPQNIIYERDLAEYNIEGYELLEKNLKMKKDDEGRGIIIYIRKGIQYSPATLTGSFCEYLNVEIMIQKEKIIFVSIYRSPRKDDENNKKLLDLLQAIGDMNIKYKLVCGDFNLPEIDWHRYVV